MLTVLALLIFYDLRTFNLTFAADILYSYYGTEKRRNQRFLRSFLQKAI